MECLPDMFWTIKQIVRSNVECIGSGGRLIHHVFVALTFSFHPWPNLRVLVSYNFEMCFAAPGFFISPSLYVYVCGYVSLLAEGNSDLEAVMMARGGRGGIVLVLRGPFNLKYTFMKSALLNCRGHVARSAAFSETDHPYAFSEV